MTTEPLPIEIGWVFAGTVPEWAEAARHAFSLRLTSLFPGFDWRVVAIAAQQKDRIDQPIRLLDLGALELRKRRWDFLFVWTCAELSTVWSDRATVMPSRAFAAAVLARDDHSPTPIEVDFWLRLLAYLAGLDTLDELAEGDPARRLAPSEIAALEPLLAPIADARLEETTRSNVSLLAFTWSAFRLNANVIRRAWQEARPWMLPFWLSGLTTAAISALVVLIVTAEAWEVGTRLSMIQAASLTLLAVLTSALFLLRRQRLLIGGRHNRQSELRIVTDITSVLCVTTGMVTAFLGLFVAAFLAGLALFDGALIDHWTGRPADLRARFGMAVLVAAIGLIIGALGASFEGQGRFRHLLHIDAELDRPT